MYKLPRAKNHSRKASDTSGHNPFSTCNKVAYNSPTEASDYEIRKGLRDQLLFSFQFIEKPAKWNYGKVTNTSVLVVSKYTYNW